jgi:hypothetical protein
MRSTTKLDDEGNPLPRGEILRSTLLYSAQLVTRMTVDSSKMLDVMSAEVGARKQERTASLTLAWRRRLKKTLEQEKEQHENHMSIATYLIDKEGADINSPSPPPHQGFGFPVMSRFHPGPRSALCSLQLRSSLSRHFVLLPIHSS